MVSDRGYTALSLKVIKLKQYFKILCENITIKGKILQYIIIYIFTP